MNVSVTDRFTVDLAAEIYGLESWGNGYLHIREDGDLLVTPERGTHQGISLREVVERLGEQGIRTPVLLPRSSWLPHFSPASQTFVRYKPSASLVLAAYQRCPRLLHSCLP